MPQTSKKIQTTRVFDFLCRHNAGIVSLRGGTRSSKTYNTLIYWIARLLQERGKTLTIARATMPALRASAMRDFFEILDGKFYLYDEACHNKTSNEYKLFGNTIEFLGVDQADRVRGRKRDYLYLNEANECALESWRQLSFRTSGLKVLDYNPSDTHSWIYEQVETREDCALMVTTYRDNPFLEASLVAEIERLQEADPDYWKVYGLGEIANIGNLIFTHWKTVDAIPEGGEKVYGLDFGYNNPSALLEVTNYDGALYWRELLYQTKLTTFDLIEKLKTFPELRGKRIICDSAEPKSIEEIRRAGFRAEAAYKDVRDTINLVKSRPLRLDAHSPNLLREIKKYSWRVDKTGVISDDEVVKFDDHLMDAGRYGSYATHSATGSANFFGSSKRSAWR